MIARKSGLRQERAHHFYPGSLTNRSLVIDLGAHKGEFSRFVASEYGCSVLGLEANPLLFAALPSLPQVRFLNLAIHTQNSPVTFHVSENPEASSVFEEVAQAQGNLTPVKVGGITLDTLLKENAVKSVDLMKVDIESAEFPMLESASTEALSKVAQITVEFHVHRGSFDYSHARVLAIAKRLRQSGFLCLAMDRDFADVLFLNPARVRLRFSERLAMAIHQYIIGVVRRIIGR